MSKEPSGPAVPSRTSSAGSEERATEQRRREDTASRPAHASGASPISTAAPASGASQKPLRGIRVLDLTNVLAGPYCSYQLMLFGAEVVKIELPGSGDLARHLGPEPELNRAGIGASFLAQNAGKKSVELDLKDAGQRA